MQDEFYPETNDRFSISAPIIEEILRDICDSIGGGGGGAASPMEETTYAALVSKRNSGALTPGMQYRITDYECTTAQEDTRAVSHPFDIIVTADDESTLNENARACLHDGDDYYSAEGSNCNLAAWELKYDLDNDTTKYAWADATNGKGVIYWMKDEKNNECPYDFKQIQFKRYKITYSVVSSLVDKYSVIPNEGDTRIIVDTENPVWCYTFNGLDDDTGSATEIDMSIASLLVMYNVIQSSYDPYAEYPIPVLNNNVMFGDECCFNTFGVYCNSNTLGDYCYSNTFGNGCYYNTTWYYCNYNTFGDNCHSNIFGDNCNSNTLGDDCNSNTFGDEYYSNTLGDSCSSNTFGHYCCSNIFRGDCHSNTFGDECGSNTLGYDCSYNTFGSNCSYNTFGGGCNSNTFGDDCYSNTFGDCCGYITSSGSSVINYYILNNVSGTEQTPYAIMSNPHNGQATYVGKQSNGTIVQWVPADLATNS